MKQTIRIVAIIVALLSLCSCTPKQIDRNDPSQTVSGFIDSIKSYDFTEIKSYLDSVPNSKTQGLLIDIYTDENYVALYKKAAKKAKYTVLSVDENESGATATISAKYYDLKTGYSTAILSIAAMAMEDEELMQQMLDEKADVTHFIPQCMQKLIDDGSLKTEEKTLTITLIKDEDQNFVVKTDDNAKTLITSGTSDAIANITQNIAQ